MGPAARYDRGVLIPLGTNRPLRHRPYITRALIILNAACFIGLLAAYGPGEAGLRKVVSQFGLYWNPSEPWRLVSYAFVHGGWWHLLGNLLILWVFGPNLEDRLGKVGFTVFYLAGAVAAGLVHVMVEPAPVVGASGAISAVTGAYLVLFPRTMVRTLVLFVIIGVWNIPALWFIGFAITRDFLLVNRGAADGVARAAHLGGYGLGIGLSLLLLWTRILRREDFDLFYLMRQGRRRREMREAMEEARARAAAAAKAGGNGETALPEEALRIRAQIAARLKDDDLPGAAALYVQLAEAFADTPGAAALTRRQQLLIANHLFQTGEHRRAAAAYERFLSTHGHDPEAANVRLMLGLVLGRYLGDAANGRRYVGEAAPRLTGAEDQALARELLAEFGAGVASGGV